MTRVSVELYREADDAWHEYWNATWKGLERVRSWKGKGGYFTEATIFARCHSSLQVRIDGVWYNLYWEIDRDHGRDDRYRLWAFSDRDVYRWKRVLQGHKFIKLDDRYSDCAFVAPEGARTRSFRRRLLDTWSYLVARIKDAGSDYGC